ncbi:disintegrin and metalloproteinase domain-containing protein 10-like [Haemaphysalis longicornis]
MVPNTGGILLLLTCFALETAVEARWLNQFVRHFEPLSYTPLPVHRDHMRVKRSLAHREKQRPGHVYLRFGGFNRIFRLRLRPDTSVFHPDLVVQTSRFGRVKPDIGHIYSGKLVGEPSSHVFGALHDGVFEGTIQSRSGRFYVEGAHKFFSRLTPFHSVLYSARDVRMPRVDGSPGWCGVRGQTARWMSRLAAGSKLVHPAKRKSRHQGTQREPRIGRRRPLAGELPTEGASHTDGGLDGGQGDRGSAKKRAMHQQTSRPKRVCGLFIAIDHLLYEKFTEPDRDPVRTRERLSTLIAGHVARASEVYRRTRFGDIEDISFSVHRIEINDTTSCPNRRAGFCLNKMDAALYLLTLSKWRVFDEFCLAYAWTYRDFDDGVIGLAYTANTSAFRSKVVAQDHDQKQVRTELPLSQKGYLKIAMKEVF